MNLIRNVWLPPDGDSRLVRFQESLVHETGRMEWAALPPFLVLSSPDRSPVGHVEVDAWILADGQPLLEARDSEGRLGEFFLGLPFPRPWSESELATLPRPPNLVWIRGRLARLELDWNDDACAVWSWTSLRGWKPALPKE